MTRPVSKWAANASATRVVAAGSFTSAGKAWIVSMSGSRGEPHECDSPWAMRSTEDSTSWRTRSEKVRMLRPSSARSEMTFSLVPTRTVPTVTTARSAAAFSRDVIVWSLRIVEAARMAGSTVISGVEPWPPRPWRVTLSESVAAMVGPPRCRIQPAGAGARCWPRQTSGVPNRSRNPSSSIACAPSPSSSAGCTTSRSRPDQVSRASARTVAAPSNQVTCMSCPQAWATPTVAPSGSTPVAVDAYGSPVSSVTGRASMSARSSTVGPGPLSSTATTPVRPTPSVTS